MKGLLAKPGRNGQWSSWLKERKIPRATADRLVAKHERSLNPDDNCLSEAISEPNEEEIRSLFDKVTPKLRRVLRTPRCVYRFLDLLASSFEGVDRQDVEEGFIVLRPSQQSSVVEPVQAGSPVEPVSLVTEVVGQ